MGKSANQALINAIADGEPNSAAEARAAWNALNNELYPTVYRTTFVSPNKTSILASNFQYSFNFSKSGNRVTMNGFIKNFTSKPPNTPLFAFTDPDFFALNNGADIVSQVFMAADNELRITDGTVSCVNTLPNTGLVTNIRFSVTYFTNDN